MSFLWTITLIAILKQAPALRILVPSNDSVLVNSSGVKGGQQGILVELLKELKYNKNDFISDKSYQTFDDKKLAQNIKTICFDKLQAGDVDYCLVPKVLDLYQQLGGEYYLSESWLPVKPVAILRRQKTDAIGLKITENYEYFLHPFYSSVWSLVFLASLITIGLLITFEGTYPFGYKLNSLWGKSSESLGIFDCIIVVYTSLFNKSPHRIPRSPCGQILIMFWYMFCVIILFSYLCGLLAQLISDGYTRGFQSDASLQVNALPQYGEIAENRVISVRDSITYDKLTSNRRIYSQYMNRDEKFLMNKLLSAEVLPSFKESIDKVIDRGYLFVTNSISSSSIYTSRKCSTYQPCSAVNFYANPIYWLGFITNNRTKLDEINSLLLSVREESGPDFRIDSDKSLMLVKIFQQITPIKLVSMNGPFVFIITGGFISIVALFCEYFYRTFVTKEYQSLNEYQMLKQEKEEKDVETNVKVRKGSDTTTIQTTLV